MICALIFLLYAKRSGNPEGKPAWEVQEGFTEKEAFKVDLKRLVFQREIKEGTVVHEKTCLKTQDVAWLCGRCCGGHCRMQGWEVCREGSAWALGPVLWNLGSVFRLAWSHQWEWYDQISVWGSISSSGRQDDLEGLRPVRRPWQ